MANAAQLLLHPLRSTGKMKHQLLMGAENAGVWRGHEERKSERRSVIAWGHKHGKQERHRQTGLRR